MLHVSSGMTVLALTVARVTWRLLNAPPPYPAGMKAWERHTAHVVHFLLYAAMVLMPLLGWGILSAHPPPGSHGAAAEFAGPPVAPPVGAPRILKIWNLFPLPAITPIEAIGREPGGVAAQHVLHKEFAEWHGAGGFLLLGLLLLHVLGALKHQFIDRLPEFGRMWIGRRRQS
jgi:cytochrome b561